MKSRVVVWTIVGLAAIAGLVFILSTPARPRRAQVTVERVQAQAAQLESQVDRLARRVGEARKATPSTDTEARLAQIETQLEQARQALAGVRQATDAAKAEEQLRAARQLMRSLRRDTETALRGSSRVPTL